MAAALRLASLRLRDCRWFSAQVGHRVWPSMAEFVQLLQSPNSLAFRRCSLAIRRTRSLRSSVWFLRRSYSARSWRLASTSDGVGSGQRFGCRAFGAGFSVGLLGVVFRAGFPTRFFLLAGRPPALAGSGREKVNSKVWPTAHLCGAGMWGASRCGVYSGLSSSGSRRNATFSWSARSSVPWGADWPMMAGRAVMPEALCSISARLLARSTSWS